MKSSTLFIVLSLAAGLVIPLQGALNGILGKQMNHPLQATFISFLGGVFFLFILLIVINPDLPTWSMLKSNPWYIYTGGFLGVIFVTMALLSVPVIGAGNFLAAALTGQMVGAIIIDHFGILNVPVQPITWTRALGILFLFVGVYLVKRG